MVSVERESEASAYVLSKPTARWVRRIERCFLHSVAFALGSTALLKLVAAAHATGALIEPDPVFTFVQSRYVLVTAAVLELATLVLVFSQRSGYLALLVCVWLGALFVTYRFCLWLTGWVRPCFCLGIPYKWLPVDQITLDRISIALLLYMLCGSLVLLSVRCLGLPTVGPKALAARGSRARESSPGSQTERP